MNIKDLNYHILVDELINKLKQRRKHLWEISEDYEDGHPYLELIHNEMEQIHKVIKLYEKNKI